MTAKERREFAILKQQAIVNAAKLEGNRALTTEEQAEFETLQREIQQATAEIEAQERGLAGNGGATNAPPQTSGMPTTDQRSEVEAERARVTEIMELCRSFIRI